MNLADIVGPFKRAQSAVPRVATRDPEIDGVTEQHGPAFVDRAEPPCHGLRGGILWIDAVDDLVKLESRE